MLCGWRDLDNISREDELNRRVPIVVPKRLDAGLLERELMLGGETRLGEGAGGREGCGLRLDENDLFLMVIPSRTELRLELLDIEGTLGLAVGRLVLADELGRRIVMAELPR